MPQQDGGGASNADEPASAQFQQVAGAQQDVQYNHMMMAFLQAQLNKVEDLEKPLHAAEDAVRSFELQIATGQRLLARHAAPFNIRDFYTVDIAHDGVRSICKELRSVLWEWGMQDTVHINDTLSSVEVQRDRDYLCNLLKYILTGACSNVDDQSLQQWQKIKCAHDDAQVITVRMVDEKDIRLGDEVGRGGWGIVHAGEWPSDSESTKKQAVAVKVPKSDVPVEEVVKLIHEAVIQGSLMHEHVAKLHAATITGWLVMELADKDLQVVCQHELLDWRLKRNLLLQAAAGVDYMHSQNPVLVHSDLKPSNFLVFGCRPEEFLVKVSDFGQTFEMRGNRSKTIRKGGGTPRWHAPEIYEDKAPTEESDVFSFGIVMYEIVTGRTPYGRVRDIVLMKKKIDGEEPCVVGRKDCPQEMLFLMRSCCKVDPKDRPTMADVRKCLEQLPEYWRHEVSSAGEGHSAPQGRCQRQGMVSQKWEARFKDINFDELVVDPELLVSFRSRLRAVLLETAVKVTGFCASLSFKDLRRGSVVFMIEVDFPSTCAAGWFKEHMEQSGEQIGEELLFYQHGPEMKMVHEICTIDAQVSELENQLQEVWAAITDVGGFHYGREIMHFLQSRIRCQVQNPLRMPNSAAKDEWRGDLTALLYEMKDLLRLVQRHSTLDDAAFVRTADTCGAVEHGLKAIRSFVHKWGLPSDSKSEQHIVPPEHLQNDRQTLEKLLGYMFEECSWPFDKLGTQEQQIWGSVKHSFQENKWQLPAIPDDEVTWDDRIAENVYKVRWGQSRFAAKQYVVTKELGMPIEDFQKLHTDACHSCLDAQHCIKLHGVTRSGAVLMDLAACNLQEWYLSLASHAIEDKVALKLRVLAQAARALHSVHAWGRIYGNVKSSNFLLFGHNLQDPVVKIADMPLMVECWHKDCIPSQATGRWMANELYQHQALSFNSDVYGFGCVAYELIMEDVPFVKSSSELDVMNAKMKGKEQLLVPKDVGRQWPKEVLDMIQRCCSSDPRERPCIRAVDGCLRQWYPSRPEQGLVPIWNNLPSTCKEGTAPLSLAAQRGNAVAIEALLDRRAPIEVQDKHGRTPLLLAAQRGHVAAIEALIGKGAQIEARALDECTPLLLAAQGGHVAAIEALIGKGAQIEARTLGKCTPLMLAAQRGHVGAIEALTAKGAQIEARDVGECTPLLLAAQGGHVAAIGALIDKGAQIEARDWGECTPLLLAAQEGHVAAIEALIGKGAQIEARNLGKCTPLLLAAQGGHVAAIGALIGNCAQIEARDVGERTPLLLAAEEGHVAAIEALTGKAAQIEARDWRKRTPLLLAAQGGHVAAIEALIGKGAQIEARNLAERTPLLLAAERGHVAAIEALIGKGAQIEARDWGECTPLLLAAEGGHVAAIGALIDKGAQIEARDRGERTPLLLAAEEGHVAAIEALIGKGAQIEARDWDGNTALHLAACEGQMEMVKFLLWRGVDKSIRNDNGILRGDTAADVARKEGHAEIAKLIKGWAKRGPVAMSPFRAPPRK